MGFPNDQNYSDEPQDPNYSEEPRVLGPSQSVAGAVDVAHRGQVFPVDPSHPDVQNLMAKQAAQAPVMDIGARPLPAPQPMQLNLPAAVPMDQAGTQTAAGFMQPKPREDMLARAVNHVPEDKRVAYTPSNAPAPSQYQGAQAGADPLMVGLNDAQTINNAYATRGGGPVKKNTQTMKSVEHVYTDAQRAEVAKNAKDVDQGQKTQLSAQQGALEAQASALDEQHDQGVALADMERANHERNMQRMQEKLATMDELERRRAAADSDADKEENSLMGKEGFTRILAGIGMMLQGATTATPEQHAQMMGFLQNNMDAELRRQKDEAKRKREKAGQYANAYQEYLAHFGDEASATAAWNAAAYKQAENMTNALAASSKSETLKQTALELGGSFQEKNAQEKNAALAASAPTVENVQTIKSGSGGARKPAVSGDAVFKAVQDARKNQGGPGADPEKINQETRFLAEKLAPSADFKKQADQLDRMFSRDSIPGTGRIMGRLPNFTEDAKETEAALQSVQNRAMNALTGAGMSEAEAERIVKGVGMSATASDEQNRRALARLKEQIAARETAVRAGVSDAANAEYNRRAGAQADPAAAALAAAGATKRGE